ncbi:MAG TPA: hypothetical protein VL335_03665 [Candidatus Paceibacterota bacterium]|jgi:hypothetical protein|nr:hypothetical protein [Candidatus Paceibacterota bacterium]
MKFEGIEQRHISQEVSANNEQITPNERTGARNSAQFKLASRYFGFDVGDEQFTKWEEEFAKKFGDIVEAQPDLLVRYLFGEETEVLNEISDLLYENHKTHA